MSQRVPLRQRKQEQEQEQEQAAWGVAIEPAQSPCWCNTVDFERPSAWPIRREVRLSHCPEVLAGGCHVDRLRQFLELAESMWSHSWKC